MRFSDILRTINENIENDIERQITDVLASLKLNNVKKIKTSQVADAYTKKGIKMDVDGVILALTNNKLVSSVDANFVNFSDTVQNIPQAANNTEIDQTVDSIEPNGEETLEISPEQSVRDMAKQALDKRM